MRRVVCFILTTAVLLLMAIPAGAAGSVQKAREDSGITARAQSAEIPGTLGSMRNAADAGLSGGKQTQETVRDRILRAIGVSHQNRGVGSNASFGDGTGSSGRENAIPAMRAAGQNTRADDSMFLDQVGYSLSADGNTATVEMYYGSDASSVTIPQTVTRNEGGTYTVVAIDDYAFGSHAELTSITIPESVRTIGDHAFSGCVGLTAVDKLDNVTSIGPNAFSSCTKLTSVGDLGKVTNIGDYAFSNCPQLESVGILSSIETIGKDAFYGCTSLKSVIITGRLAGVEEGVFRGCSALELIVLPGSVSQIGYRAFANCSSLTTITIPSGVASIARAALMDCNQLETVRIENANCSIASDAFIWGSNDDVQNLRTIIFQGTKETWESMGVALPTDALIWCVSGTSDPADDTVIGTLPKPITITGEPSSGSDVLGGQKVQLQIGYDGGIPDGIGLPVRMVTSSAESSMDVVPLTSLDRTKDVECVVTGSVNDTAQVVVAEVGGQDYSAQNLEWTGKIIGPVVEISADKTGPVSPGETVMINIQGQNVPTPGIAGTLDLTGMSPTTQAATAHFALDAGDMSETKVACTIEDGAASASARISQMQVEDIPLTPPTTEITVDVDQMSAPPTSSSDLPAASSSQAPTDGIVSVPPINPVFPFPVPTPPGGQLPSGIESSGHMPPVSDSSASPEDSVPPGSVPETSGQIIPSTGHQVPIVSTAYPVSYPSSGTSAPRPSGGTSSASPTAQISPAASEPAASQSSAPGTMSPTQSATVPASSASPAPDPIEIAPDAPSGVQVEPNPDGSGTILVGAQIGSLWNSTDANTVSSWIEGQGAGETIRIVSAEGKTVPMDAQIATGMTAEVVGPDGGVLQSATMVVMGDVTGSGEMNLTQVVRVAAAYVGRVPLEGAYALAADLDGNNTTDLTDVVKIAEMYQESTVGISYAVSDDMSTEVLHEAGYSIEAWTQDAVLIEAGIPENAEIESIAWTQHDVFPDGREQTLFYEGDEESLIFGTYDAGHTDITVRVRTSEGKVGTRQVELDWGPESGSTSDTAFKAESDNRANSVISRIAGESEPRASGKPTASKRPVTISSPAASASGSHPTPSAAAGASNAGVRPTSSASSLLFAFRNQCLAATNALRSYWRIDPELKTSSDLAKAAMVRAQEMAAAGVLDHTRPDGSKYSTVVTLGQGIVVGENIHSNRGYPQADVAKTASKSWENSAPHRKQMLEPRYKYTGFGFAQASDGTWYCVELFSNGDNVLSIDKPKA